MIKSPKTKLMTKVRFEHHALSDYGFSIEQWNCQPKRSALDRSASCLLFFLPMVA